MVPAQNTKTQGIDLNSLDLLRACKRKVAGPVAAVIEMPRSYVRGSAIEGIRSYLPNSKVFPHDLDHTLACDGSDEEEDNTPDKDFTEINQADLRGFAEGQPPNDPRGGNETPPNEPDKGIIYARRSQKKEEGRSLMDQVSYMKTIAEENGIDIVEVIKEDGQTGTNFDRDGIKKVAFLARRDEISYVLIDDLSRLGRSAPETLYFIHVLENDFDVELMTHTGSLDISEVEDLIQIVMESLISHMSTQYRSRSAIRSRIGNFCQEKDWTSWFSTVPLGYELGDDDWLVVEGREVEVVQTMFRKFVKNQAYAQTAREISQEYGEILGGSISGHSVKRLLQRRVYVGEPTINIENVDVEGDEKSVVDPSLQIVGDETFERAQQIIAEISRENSSSSNDGDCFDIESGIEQFGLFALVDSSPVVKIICPQPDCDGSMRGNGQRDLTGNIYGRNYECRECGKQRQWPYLDEFEDLLDRFDDEENGEDENTEESD